MHGRLLNSQSVDHKSDVLTNTLLRHLHVPRGTHIFLESLRRPFLVFHSLLTFQSHKNIYGRLRPLESCAPQRD